MARASPSLIASPAAAFGRLVAAYSRAVVKASSAEILFDSPTPQGPTVWVTWHEGNLLALALHKLVTSRAAMAFVPPGMQGSTMSAWLEALDVTPVPLAPDARRGLGLRHMEAALASGKDVLIAVDGPNGPHHRIAPGAMWLARAMDVEIRPVGCARIALVVGAALPKQKSAEAKARLAATLHGLSERALAELTAKPKLAPTEAVPWR
jgi:lysophospholipid acyltransferase (LPLAT)-like uncharacterized protein